jgi:hypothetical protein
MFVWNISLSDEYLASYAPAVLKTHVRLYMPLVISFDFNHNFNKTHCVKFRENPFS